MPTTSSVDALIAAGLVDPARRAEALDILRSTTAPATTTPSTARAATSVATEIAGYVGGILVVAAAAVFIGTEWSSMAALTRVLALVLSGLLLVGAGLAATRLGVAGSIRDAGQDIRRYLASVLLVGGAVVLGGAVGVWAAELTSWDDIWASRLALITITVLAGLSYVVVPSAVAQLVTAWSLGQAFAVITFGTGDLDHSALLFAALLLVTAVAWGLLTEAGAFRERQLGRFISGVLAVVGAQFLSFESGDRWWAYLALAVIGTLCFALYVRRGAWPHLAVGVVALTMAATEAALDLSDGSVGAAGALLIAGTVLLSASVLGMRLRRRAAS